MSKKLLPILTTALMWGCSTEQNSNSAPKGVIDPGKGIAVLGEGYDTQSEEFKAACVQPTDKDNKYIYAGQQRAELNFSRSMSLDELKTLLEVQVKGKLSLEAFNASGSTRFLAQAASSDLSTSLVYSAILKGKSAKINGPTLTETGLTVSKTGLKPKIRERCGDEYVDAIDLGAQLLVNLRFDFANSEVKSEFESEIDLDFVDLFQVSGAAKVAFEKYKKNVRISVSAIQVGGNVTQLPTIFKATAKGVPIVECDFENQESCAQAVSDIVTYASDTFPKQLKSLEYDPSKENSAAVLAYRTKPYVSGGGNLDLLSPDPSDVLQQSVIDTRKNLLDLYQIQSRDRERVTQVLKMRLTQEEDTFFKAQFGILERNIAKVVTSAEACYKDTSRCMRNTNQLGLEPYDSTKLTKTRRFLDFCDQDKRPQSVEDTITSVRGWLGSNADDNCDAVHADLLQQQSLELKGIRDLRPLHGLTNLLTLSATDGTITNISTVSSLTGLKKLNLRTNNISSIAALSSLTNLTELDLAHNRLVDLEPLRKLKNLRVVKLFSERNRILDFGPVEDLPNLKVLYTTFESICTAERKWALDQGLIPLDLFGSYEAIGFAPVYNTPTVRESGIAEWINCPFVVLNY